MMKEPKQSDLGSNGDLKSAHYSEPSSIGRSTSVGRPRSLQTETNILDSVKRLVPEYGYAATSIEKVAANAGVGKASIYRRWGSKAAMMISVYRWLVPEESLQSKSDCFEKNFHYLLNKLFKSYRDSPSGIILIGIIAESQSNQETLSALKHGVIQERRVLLTEILKQGIASGKLHKGINLIEITDLITAMIWHRLLTDRSNLNSVFIDLIIKTVIAVGKC